MILIDNRNVLRVKERNLLEELTEVEKKDTTGNVIVEQAKTGVPTLKMLIDGKSQYIHSKYDPIKDAERLIGKNQTNSAKHVLFVGAGLGYHIKKFTEVYPDIKFSIYEPDEEVLLSYLSHTKLDDLPLRNLNHIFMGTDFDILSNKIKQLLQISKGMLQIITLPVYEKVYGEPIERISKQIVASLKEKRSSLVTDISFQKRWTVNSIKNFPTVLKTPNILHDIDKSAFEGKPAIIVAAGPSLNEEFENLRYIKENGLAYIFSVGSAINALIEHEIYPDAACTYDPGERNQFVIKKIKDKGITNIPLIFGSSVGFETLEEYPGKMFHMITSQDTVSRLLLKANQPINGVNDAPSIAVVTFQLLAKLGCTPIVLVGQNLGYQSDKRYASGIEYDFVDNDLSDKEKENALMIKDVFGNDIQTNDGFNRMRQQLEMYIGANQQIEVINTTKGGAQIDGASFVYLDNVINERLKTKVVNDSWIGHSTSYDLDYTEKQLIKLSSEVRNCEKSLQNAQNELKKIHEAVKNKQSKNMGKRFASLDKEINKLKRNLFYNSFVEPMVRVENEQMTEKSQLIRFETDILKKANGIVQSFGGFMQQVYLQVEFARPYFEEMKEQIEEIKVENEQ